jgi:hypothetical protein
MIHQPIKINMKSNLLTDKRKYNNKAESISNNKDNIYTKINNNYNLKKIVKDKENIINEDLCPETIDAQQKNNNSFLYNTNSCINSIYLKEINSNSDYENTLSNTINQMQSTFTEKISNKIFKRNEKENFESKIKDNINREYIRINELKEKGQCICNIYEGGTGGTTSWWTDDLRKKYSENNVMKSEKQRERMKKNNPMSNNNIAEKTNGQKRRKVIIGNITYKSIKDAKQILGVSYSNLITWNKKGITPNGEKIKIEPQKQHWNKYAR